MVLGFESDKENRLSSWEFGFRAQEIYQRHDRSSGCKDKDGGWKTSNPQIVIRRDFESCAEHLGNFLMQAPRKKLRFWVLGAYQATKAAELLKLGRGDLRLVLGATQGTAAASSDWQIANRIDMITLGIRECLVGFWLIKAHHQILELRISSQSLRCQNFTIHLVLENRELLFTQTAKFPVCLGRTTA